MMENKSVEENVVSTQKTLQATHDPGWNDPPKWAYSSAPNPGSTPTKRLLNKRVAFPLSSSTSSSPSNQSPAQTLPPTNLPPPPVQATILTTAPHAPLLTPSRVTTEAPAIETPIDKEQALSSSLDNLQAVINAELKGNSKVEEVQRRLDTMKTMWREDKLNREIHGKILEISKALQCNDIETADKIHVSIVMNHATLCNTWISAIRQLILALKEKSVQNDTEVASKSQPLLLLNPAESK